MTVMISLLPREIQEHLPLGYQPAQGVWLVLPEPGEANHGIAAVNSWLRAEEWYPSPLNTVVWFGDDGVGNFLGWVPEKRMVILWNPEDGESPWKEGSVQEIWAFVQGGYR